MLEKMKNSNRKKNFNIMGNYVDKYKNIYIVLLCIVSLFELVLMIRGFILYKSWSINQILYMVSYVFLLVMSLSVLSCLVYGKFYKLRNTTYSFLVHLYCGAIVLWALNISYIDMLSHNPPIVYMTVIVTIAGIVILDPFVFGGLVISTVIAMIVLDSTNGFNYFVSSSEYINFFVFIVMAILINVRHYLVSVSETKAQTRLEHLSKTDMLTGLKNESAYIAKVEELEKSTEKNYAVIVMDCNNIKTTNDTYGHRFGCHLIVKTGEILPLIFESSDLFHIGGDEFVAVVQGCDLKNIDSILKGLDEKLVNQEVELEGIKLNLTVAYGYQEYKKGMLYREVFQLADEKMYDNKEEIKTKYGVSLR